MSQASSSCPGAVLEPAPRLSSWSSGDDLHQLQLLDLPGSRTLDGSRDSEARDLGELGPSLLAFLKCVANFSYSSTGHDLSKINSRASELFGVLQQVLQLSSDDDTNGPSCHLDAFSTIKTTAMSEGTQSRRPTSILATNRQVALPSSSNFQLWANAVTSETQPQKSKIILTSYNCDNSHVYNLSGVNHRRRGAKRNTSASSLLSHHMVVLSGASQMSKSIVSVNVTTAGGPYGIDFPEPSRKSCPFRPQIHVLKPLALNTPFELPRADKYLEKPTAKAKEYLLKNAGAVSSSTMSSALSLDACTNGWPLTTVCMWIFQVHDVLGPMYIKSQTMEQYLLRIEAGYLPQNGYHNRAHAADVTLQMYALLQNCFELSAMPRQAESSLLLTCTLAAAIHDFMHPGSNNQFQVEIDSEASLVYNGKSTIENFSTSSALGIARDMGLFSDMPRSSAKQICKDIVDIVLASDMSAHFDVISSFKSTFASTKGLGNCNPGTKDTPRLFRDIHTEQRETRMVVLKLAMKIADLGHCYLPWAEHLVWVERLQEEFFTQGDMERAEALPISPMMDRSEPGVGDHGNSIGFYNVFVMPMLEAWTKIYPTCLPFLEQARSNLELHMKMAERA